MNAPKDFQEFTDALYSCGWVSRNDAQHERVKELWDSFQKPPTTDGGPAFPHGPLGDSLTGEDGLTRHQWPAGCGMSLREWYAGQALMGYLAGTDPTADIENFDKSRVASCCYSYADAMLSEREKGGGS